ncbi:DUF2330 domain-containing protein [Nannocystis pusilla]|uniref:DUF2330 domain-containing protein n=1 Tax=Nannocystis pusilla TaxID=889268 RepID=A0A9X3IY30_9BACT|nr:DUF2330 domain-containing protein [Nannocystis pusilla]MCY1007615.1 DUF2330 domain-containing protein [Nannocystis pusilla]
MLAALPPNRADACGGTVCEPGPNAMPVDQTGENILFIIDQGQVEVHIQIQYDPDTNAQQFAWLIPLPEVPTFSVGSELLFQELLNATVPTYGLQDNFEFCGGDTDSFPATSGASFTGDGTTGDGTDTGVIVKKIETVGAFEVVVLAGMNAGDIMQWLGDNGYQQDPNAEPILQEYLDEGNSVVAFKLSNDEGLSSIHPIVLSFAEPEGCVPIRLTRIAAVEDMDIRAFSLGDGRAIPTNYRHVLVNPLKIDWLNLGANYKEVVSLAVDAFMAEGHAFVTEFAGDSNVLNIGNFYSQVWSADPFTGLAAVDVMSQLNQQGLTDCTDEFFCQFNHPLVQGLLSTYLPVPNGITAEQFYSCLSCFEADIDLGAWGDGSGFAKDLLARVIEPAEHAKTLVETWPYLTRLYTTISPNEMTEDPLFLLNPELPDVPNLRIAQRDISCEDFSVVTLPDGRQVNMNFGDPWPQFQDEMPWEEDVDQMVMDGMPQPLVDNTPLIDQLLAEWNQQHPPPPRAPPAARPPATPTAPPPAPTPRAATAAPAPPSTRPRATAAPTSSAAPKAAVAPATAAAPPRPSPPCWPCSASSPSAPADAAEPKDMSIGTCSRRHVPGDMSSSIPRSPPVAERRALSAIPRISGAMSPRAPALLSGRREARVCRPSIACPRRQALEPPRSSPVAEWRRLSALGRMSQATCPRAPALAPRPADDGAPRPSPGRIRPSHLDAVAGREGQSPAPPHRRDTLRPWSPPR